MTWGISHAILSLTLIGHPALAPEIPIPHLCFLLWSIHFNQSYLCSFGTIHWSLVKIHQWIHTSRPWRTLSWDPLVINTSAGRNWGLCIPHYPWLTEDSVQQAQCLDLQLLWGYNCSNYIMPQRWHSADLSPMFWLLCFFLLCLLLSSLSQDWVLCSSYLMWESLLCVAC